MSFNIRAGKRVLYKHNGKWEVGELANGQYGTVNEKGLFLYIIPKEFIGKEDIPFYHDAEINDIFLDASPVENWMKQYHYLMTKEEYIAFIESEDFNRATEQAWVSDGEYYYYPVNKYSATWILKQPFEYIVRDD